MTTEQQQQKGREFLDLEVKEISLVDKPANLREFLTLKRKQEADNMGAFQTNYEGADPSEVGIETPIEKAKPEGLAADLVAVADLVDKTEGKDEAVAKALDPALKAAIQRVMGFLGRVATGGLTMKSEVKKAEGEPAETPAAETPPPPIVAVMTDGAVHVEGEAVDVEKAKGFTAARMGTVKQAATALLKLLKDIDADTLKGVIGDVNKDQELPTQASIDSQVRPDAATAVAKAETPAKEEPATEAAPVTKAETPAEAPAKEEPTTAAPGELTVKLDDVCKRLDAIETARAPSKSAEPAQATQTAEPVRKSFWQDVL